MAKTNSGRKRIEKKELRLLAKDFLLWDVPGVQELIENATSYNAAHRQLMKIYEQQYCMG